MKTGRRQGETCVFSCFQWAAWEGRRPGVYLAGGSGGGGSADELQALFYQFVIVRKSRAILAAFLCFSPSASSPRVGFGWNLTFSLKFARGRFASRSQGGTLASKLAPSTEKSRTERSQGECFCRCRLFLQKKSRRRRSQGERFRQCWLRLRKKDRRRRSQSDGSRRLRLFLPNR